PAVSGGDRRRNWLPHRRSQQEEGRRLLRGAGHGLAALRPSVAELQRIPVHELTPRRKQDMSHQKSQPLTRRQALRTMVSGFGMMAFANMIGSSIARAGAVAGYEGRRLPKPHHEPKAKNI